MAYSKDAFVNFSELDLDFILGDFTESECDFSSSDWSKHGKENIRGKLGQTTMLHDKNPSINKTQPTEIGAFSVDVNRCFKHDKSQLKYYVRPRGKKVHFDLKQGYESMIKKDELIKNHIDFILRWILLNGHKFSLKEDKADTAKRRDLHTDIVCWRGLLTKLLCTPYERKDGWIIASTLFNGTIYLNEFDTEEKREHEARKTARDEEMCCWGWKFEQYLVSDDPEVPAEPTAVYNNIEGFCTVVRSRLSDHSLVFAGEVDCVDAGPQRHYVELKTSREISHSRQNVNFKRFKLIKWWAQSFLVGIPEIVCGFRDDDGVVHSLESYDTKALPRIAADIRDPWKPNVCFNFLNQMLRFIKSAVKKDNARVVYLFEWYPGSDVTCKELPCNSDYAFLPDWYIHPDKLPP